MNLKDFFDRFGKGDATTTPFLNSFSRDLTQEVEDGRLDPVIDREKEIARAINILGRRTKNNVLLLGEPGVGKTAIAEGLAIRIHLGVVPDSLKHKRLLMLNLTMLISGTKYRGDLEKRLSAVTQEIQNSKRNLIVFIDEIHTLVQAKGAEGGLNPADILKPALARGELQMIGATTFEDYKNFILHDQTLERRFQPIIVREPDAAHALKILLGIKGVYEEFHHVSIPAETVELAVKLSEHYIADRFLPDKAIDLMDEAGAKVSLLKRTAGGESFPTVTGDDIRSIIADWLDQPIDTIDYEKEK